MAWGDDIINSTTDIVEGRFATSEAYAQSAYAMAIDFLNQLKAEAQSLEPIAYTPSFDEQTYAPTYDDLLGEKPDAPADALLEMTFPGAPTAPTYDATTIDPTDIPELDATAPTVTIPDTPSTELPSSPSDIPTVTAPDMPTMLDYTMPDLPELATVTIPAVPSPSFPEFDSTLPDWTVVVPSYNLAFSGTEYTSELIAALIAVLLDDLTNGANGLPESAEDAIYNREYERALQAHLDATDKIAADWTARGFTLPDGFLVNQLTQAEIDFSNKRQDIARDIVIKSVEWAQKQKEFTINKIIEVEGKLMEYSNMLVRTAWEAQKATAEVAIEIYKAEVSRYNALLDAYKTEAAVYETKIKAEISKLEAVKTEIEAQKVKSQVNMQLVEAYKAQLAAVATIVDIYKTEVEATMATVQVGKLRIEAFKSQVDAYVAQVNAKVSLFQMYSAQIDGEKAKVSIYASQVDAYKGRVEAARVDSQTKIERARLVVDGNKELSSRYSTEVEAFKNIVVSEVERVGGYLKKYESQIKGYEADSRAYGVLAESDIKLFQARIEQATNEANILIKNAEIAAKNAELLSGLTIEAIKGGATVAAHLAAGALSAMHVQAGMSIDYHGASTYSESEITNY